VSYINYELKIINTAHSLLT